MASQENSPPMMHRHPRRRALATPPPSLLNTSDQLPMRLRKGETFHSPNRPSSRDPSVNFPLLPRRSPTCPKALEAIAAGQDRMTKILDSFDINNFNSPGDHHDIPVPRSLLRRHMDSQAAAEDRSKRPIRPARSPKAKPAQKPQHTHCHASDSGLGTSVCSSEGVSPSTQEKMQSAQMETKSWTGESNKLSTHSREEIESRIISPLLKEKKMRPYHKIVEGLRKQIEKNEIRNLRDLEKTMFLIAPGVTEATTSTYENFCSFSVSCLQQTVTHIAPRDLHLPSDKPYTNGYFVDLIDQIRRYKAIRDGQIREARETRKAGEKATAPASPRLTLEGGLAKTGHPAQFVIHHDGESTSLRTGKPYESEAGPSSFKRTLNIEMADEGVERSMARRKKNAPPMNINQKCAHCDKIFRRPCDLTKHEKTHVRPFKCPEPTCKFHRLGWPTEKENERHYNDKHSKTPKLYNCVFGDCTYFSRRQSNVKQHMEKTHGWVYVRTKNNGRKSKDSIDASPETTDMPTPVSSAAPEPMNLDLSDMSPAQYQAITQPTSTGADFFPTTTTAPSGAADFFNSLATSGTDVYNYLPATATTGATGFSNSMASSGAADFNFGAPVTTQAQEPSSLFPASIHSPYQGEMYQHQPQQDASHSPNLTPSGSSHSPNEHAGFLTPQTGTTHSPHEPAAQLFGFPNTDSTALLNYDPSSQNKYDDTLLFAGGGFGDIPSMFDAGFDDAVYQVSSADMDAAEQQPSNAFWEEYLS